MSGMTMNPNTARSFIEAQQYDTFILQNLHDVLLPQMFYRNVTNFTSGEVLNIKTVGSVTIQDVEDETPLVYNPIETGNVQMRITDWKGDAWAISDKLRQDGTNIEMLLAQRAQEGLRALDENFETRFLETAYEGLTEGDPNTINGWAHKRVATGNNQTLDLEDLAYLQLAADEANVPQGGRVLIVPPVVATTLNQTFQLTQDTMGANDFFMGVMKTGFAQNHRLVTNIYGWTIMTSTRLPRIVSETVDGTTVTNGIACVGMCVADDNCKPVMYAERAPLKTESERNKDLGRDEFVSRRRYGLGVQRKDTLFSLLVAADKYK